MISSLQPNRPRLPAPPPHSPLNQQPARVLSTPTFPPRTQIEAMPPQPRRFLPAHTLSTVTYDSSVRHPVFFTDRLKRAPNGVMAGNTDKAASGWGSPVAAGYVFNGPKKEGVSRL